MTEPQTAPAQTPPALTPPDRVRGGRLTTLLLVLVLALGVPFGFAFSRLWAATGSDIAVARSEQDGTRYLRPLVTLVAATVDLQSAAVQGREPDAVRVRTAVADVDRVDAALGGRLRTTQRWKDARARVLALLEQPSTGGDAYRAGGQVVDLLVALAGTVGDSSSLILDPDLDSYYLMDATLLRVPALLVAAGRVGDLTVLTGAGAGNGAAGGGVALARATVRDQATALDTGLRKSFAATDSRTLGAGLLPQLDLLQDTVARFAPPAAEVGAVAPAPDRATVERTRLQVRDAALGLEAAALTQLEQLLDARRAGVDGDRRVVVAVTAAGGLAALAVLWYALGGTARRAEEDGPEEPEATAAEDLSGVDPELLEARDLLAAQQLLRVGRAVAPSREDR